ncbi:hypothetical protein JCM13304A_15060 [Desulfothermus okinawensis JCM 13304]
MKRYGLIFLFLSYCYIQSCSVVTIPYRVTKTAIKTTYRVTKFTVKTTIFAGKVVYKVGKFTYVVAKAPFNLPLTHPEIEAIDGLPPKIAIKERKVKNSPYIVFGKRYVPFSVDEAKNYREVGYASWYGYETLRQKGGHMTANGELFDPHQLTAAHKLLPLPWYVKVTNLENGRSIIVRVNDRGPFVKGRIIDLTIEGAKRLGFYKKGIAKVLVESIVVKQG